MSQPSSAPNRTSPPASVRSNAPQTPGHGAPHPSSSPARPDVTPKSLSQTGRSKTAPLALDNLWTPSVDRPQLSERDSIFATTYLASESAASSPHSPAQTIDTNDNASGNGRANMAVAVPAPRRLTDAPASRPQRPPQPPSTFKDHQGLLLTRFNSPRRDEFAMSADGSRGSPPPFMSPVDSPVHRPITPPHTAHMTVPLVDILGESEERIKNRLWREGKAEAYLPHKGTGLNLIRDGHVDKKIEATLAKTEPPAAARSRKASHYLRVFKENDAAEEMKKREGRVKDRRPVDKSLHSQQEEGTVRPDSGPPLEGRSRTSSTVRTPQERPVDSYFDRAPTPEITERDILYATDLQRHKHEIPPRLLEEIRNYQNLTPGATHGSSFSRSLPMVAAEKLRAHAPENKHTSHAQEASDYFQLPRDGSVDHSLGSEDEDSDREQISSALYFPHRQLKSAEELLPTDDVRKTAVEVIQKRSAISEGKGPEGWDKDEAVKTPQEVEISLQSQDTNQCLHGDIQTTPALNQEANKPLTSAIAEATTSTESEDESLTESSHSFHDSESSATDDLGTTPTATPRKKKGLSAAARPPAPLGAVELKPFDHQVGGHTTVYRFSRRAVCKQLNNRENEFYETVERQHPELLEFLPRYIGVLNVTYRKGPKRKKTLKDKAKVDDKNAGSATQSNVDGASKQEPGVTGHNVTAEDAPRMVSHSQSTTSVPQVIFENNRHIIPDNLFRVPPRSATPDPWTGNSSFPSKWHRRNQSEVGFSSREDPTRPPMHQQSSWGVTTINRQLQEEVLRQVFAPPPIHHRHRHHHRGLPSRLLRGESHGIAGSTPAMRRNSADVSQVAVHEEESTRKSVLRAEHHRHVSNSTSGSLPKDAVNLARTVLQPSTSTASRRRHSGGGLTRRPCGVDTERRSHLEFYEEEGYRGDGEEELFAMDEDRGIPPEASQESTQSREAHQQQDAPDGSMLPAPLSLSPMITSPPNPEPANPEEAQQQHDERVQHFLLLEDLTAGMSKPCVLDLKMGTRQYGIEADEKKQRSQRRKCKMTTSQQLGVRVCGMQIWNVKTQSYLFEDKYYGRDLKAGKEFQDALKRFFWDGNGYKAATRHIPVILEKISALENMIRNLPGYRFYASSLLMLYDRGEGEQKEKETTVLLNGLLNSSSDDVSAPTSPNPNGPKSTPASKSVSEIKLKIVDFANCVTAEDPLPDHVPCPPSNPDGVDRGYLRGLRSLRLYFQRIWRDVNENDWVERGEGEGMSRDSSQGPGMSHIGPGWMDHPHTHGDDSGNVSI